MPPFQVLVVDDEPLMHAVTAMVLDGVQCHQRPLSLVHAYSACEARRVIQERADIAVILLDVMMETDCAGLDLLREIRQDLALAEVRVILRTGQPGQDFDYGDLQRYDVSAYRPKTELTRAQLIDTVVDAARRYAVITGQCRVTNV